MKKFRLAISFEDYLSRLLGNVFFWFLLFNIWGTKTASIVLLICGVFVSIFAPSWERK